MNAADNPQGATGLDVHGDNEPHRYRIECEVCGQRGMVNLSIEPQVAASPTEPDCCSYDHPHGPGDVPLGTHWIRER